MKKIFASIALLASLLLPVATSAQMTVVQGGTGLSSVPTNSFLVGGSNPTLRLVATSSPFFSMFSFGTATGTAATTTSFFSTNIFGTLLNGFGLTTCNGASQALTWSSGLFGCQTISSGGGAGTVGTSTVPTIGQIAYWTSNGYPSLLGSVATSTLTASSPLTGSFTHVGTTGSLGCQTASGSQAGCLSSADWTTFNGKQTAGNYITALTGDVTATGPGSVAATLATVNSNVGSFGGVNSIPSFTVNAKGLITAASANVPAIPASEITAGTFGAGNYIFPGQLQVNSSTTLQNFTFSNATGTQATTTNFYTSGQTILAATSGNVGIGSTSPYAQLGINAPAGTAPYFSIGSSTNEVLKVSASANPLLGVGTTSPWRTLSITGTVGLDGLSAAAGTVFGVCLNSSTKELQVNSLANCTVSSARFKHDINTLDIGGISTVMAMRPASFVYNGTDQTRYGFIAEEMAEISPNLVAYGKDGKVETIDDIGISAITIKAIQEQQEEIANIKSSARSLQDKWQDVALILLALAGFAQQRQIENLKHRA